MRYKVLIAGAAIVGLLLFVQALGVFGASPRLDRGQSTAMVSVAITPIKLPAQPAQDAEAERVRASSATAIAANQASSQPAAAEASTATPVPANSLSAANAIRRVPVVPTATTVSRASGPLMLNGLPIETLIVAPAEVTDNVRRIYARGQSFGRNPNAFSKVGDSTMLWPLFMVHFDWGNYRLGDFATAQRTIDRFRGSFARESLAVRKGMHSWGEFDPAQAEPTVCREGEGPLACELRVHNPSFALIRLGANDSLTPEQFEPAMRRILDTCIAGGIVPILGTKPDHYEGPQNTINQMIRQMAASYRIPLWDFDLVAETIPGRGLQPDGLHLADGGSDDFTLPSSFTFIGPVADLSALLSLDVVSEATKGK